MNTPTLNRTLSGRIRAEATEWLLAFSEGEMDTGARQQFNAWLRTSPEHVRAYLRVAAFWENADGLAKGSGDIDALVRGALAETNVVSLESPSFLSPLPQRGRGQGEGGVVRKRRFAFAAAALIVCITASVWFYTQRSPTYTTATGEQRNLLLPDGSSVELNARSRITLRFNGKQRLIELTEGQALFRVAKDRARPFIVRSGDTHVRALGTRFDVNRKQTGVVVTVLEGRVEVAKAGVAAAASVKPVPLAAGEQAVATARSIIPVKAANLVAATAWTQHLLVFDAAPLSEVVREFNRHNLKALIIDDAALGELRISGIFPATGAERIIEFLHKRFNVIARASDTEIHISRH